MTREDSPSDDARDEPEDVGGFRFGMADGSGDPEGDRGGATDSRSFLGFDFGRWLRETDVRPSTTTKPDPAETTDADVARETAEAAPTFEGFDFAQWMADADVGPRKPPEEPRVVGATPTADRAGVSGLLAALPFAGSAPEDTYEGGFDFAEWLGEGDADLYEPVDVEPTATTAATPTPEASATATAAAGGSGGFGETPEFPGPPGGGISDTPPVKLAALALFTAALVAVALTAAGAIAPLGPADGFGSAGGGDGGGAQEQPVGTNNSTATDTDDQTPQDTPTSTPTDSGSATPEPTATPTATPTPEPTPSETATPTESSTETPTETETATPTPTENGSDDGSGGLLDPIFGGSSSSSSDDSLIDL
ncbi:hypothetical protein HWV07_19445 [Natronomonas salina]|uniref:hypothetical protein n=1 Tax=Natronomonas salina TaxID=1710540 RepID=UPI0015B712CA|nr:hypothetical protein [Natronomonas salina]QLD91101.1 hypothetical protein HWV07_19445 [Natronomonas salina]